MLSPFALASFLLWWCKKKNHWHWFHTFRGCFREAVYVQGGSSSSSSSAIGSYMGAKVSPWPRGHLSPCPHSILQNLTLLLPGPDGQRTSGEPALRHRAMGRAQIPALLNGIQGVRPNSSLRNESQFEFCSLCLNPSVPPPQAHVSPSPAQA